MLGAGFAAFRDVASFFKNQVQDDVGTRNPLANGISWVIGRGVSQSGNFLRGFLHLGFNQDEAGRQVYEGAWPIIAGRRVALNFRFAMPDGVLKLYEPGSEGPQWWVPWPDPVRNLPTRGILDRCTASHTCPKVIEHFGAAEVWGLKLTPGMGGHQGRRQYPADRRYPPVLHPEHPAWRRERRLQRQPRRLPPVAPARITVRARSQPIRSRTRRRSTRYGSISATGSCTGHLRPRAATRCWAILTTDPRATWSTRRRRTWDSPPSRACRRRRRPA